MAKQRDADRSRAAILHAAEELFARHGYDAVTLQDIGDAAGVSRATPSYFFGSKDAVYAAALERVFADREAAVEAATAPLRRCAEGPAGDDVALRRALGAAVRDYLRFLLERPAFTRLVAWEGLAGGRRLRATPRASRALHDAFTALRRAGLRFDVDDAVLLFVTLTLSPITQRDTFMTTLGRDLAEPAAQRRHVALVADQLLHFLTKRS